MGSPRLQPITPRWTRGSRSVVLALIAANVVAFIGETLIGLANPQIITDWLALSMDGIRHGHVWELVTYMFIHGDPAVPITGVVHLLVNMLMLYFAGREVEAIVGPRHLLGIYFLGGIAGGIAQILVSPAGQPVGGASAGVCALLLAFTTILPEVEVILLLFFVIPLRLRAKYLGALVVGSSVLFAVTGWFPAVAHVAHLCGAFVGWLYVKRLGFGQTWRVQRFFRERREREERLARMPADQFIQEEIDPILEKISRQGLRSLTRAERKILERAPTKIGAKCGTPKG